MGSRLDLPTTRSELMAVKSLIETVTVGSGGAASIEWTAINQDGQDLVIVLSSRNGEAVTNVSSTIQINGVTPGVRECN